MNKEDLLTSIISLIVGGFLTHFWIRYRERISKLRYTVWHNNIGFSMDDAIFGSIRVTYQNIQVANLFYSTIYLYNENNVDIGKFTLNIVCDSDSKILATHGSNKSSLNVLNFSNEYNSILNNNNPNDVAYLFSRRDYEIPAFNRGDTIEINCVIIRENAELPVINLGTDEKGVRLVYKSESQKILGESLLASLLLGLGISIILCGLIYLFIDNQLISVSLSLVVGLSSTLFGAIFLKIYNPIARLLR